ncbi:MAG TPA: hypothetical protein VHP30_12090 [Ignavibacteriales bacterium]|jgi:hypothetical protein|nr:hypothetical protein [Ignavibacteriales bacterium]
MPRKTSETLSGAISAILSSVGISYTSESGSPIPVKSGKLLNMAPLHSKVKTRLYVELMGEGGVPYYHIIGVITDQMNPDEVVDMKLKAEFNDRKGVKQVWVNEEDFEQVRVIIPSSQKVLTFKTTEPEERKKKKYPEEGFTNIF